MNHQGEKKRFFVAYPEQAMAANSSKCWNWFKPQDQQRGKGEPSLIAGITEQVMADYPVDASRIYIAGLSAGGAGAAIMGQAYPDLYAAIGVHSGLASGAAHDLPSALAAMRQGGAKNRSVSKNRIVPTISFHGDRDMTVNPCNGDQVIEEALSGDSGLTARQQNGQVPDGHPYERTLHSDSTGKVMLEHWLIKGAGHAWSGGSTAGSYTDSKGPNASREMIRFFLEHSLKN